MTIASEQEGAPTMTSTTYQVQGMTCEHCVSAVRAELVALDGVTGVSVVLNAGGVSEVTITAAATPSTEQVAAALDEAGDYRLLSAAR